MAKNLVRLAGIAENSLVNGPGLRKVLFSQGCTHNCKNCFNPDTFPFEGGEIFDMDEIITTVKKETFLSGVTFSGGDPFQQPDKFAYMAKEFSKINVNIWAYTGYTFEQLQDIAKKDLDVFTMISNCDVIVDGEFKCDLADTSLQFKGSSNQRVIDVKKTLKNKQIILWKENNNI